jgi:hypothetical protein
MATTSRPYKTNANYTPGTDESGMQPAPQLGTGLGYGSDALNSPGAPAVIETHVVGGEATVLDRIDGEQSLAETRSFPQAKAALDDATAAEAYLRASALERGLYRPVGQ